MNSQRTRLVIVSGLLALSAACKKETPPPPAPPVVKVAEVVQRDVPIYVEAIGQTRGSTEIEVRARVEGFIESVNYEEGGFVRKGQLLYAIDPRPFEAGVAQATAETARAEAQLARAAQDVALYEPLVAKNAISRQEYDTAVQAKHAAEAGLAAAKATQTNAELDLSFASVVSPANGIAGKTEVYAGTLVGRGQSTLLTRISQVDTIHVRVTIPEKDFIVMNRKREERKRAEAEETLAFEMVLADGSTHPEKGKLVFVDRAVDPTTGTILVEVAFPNPGALVRPGQYARVRVAIDETKGAIVIPQRAITELQGIYNVAVVKPDDTIEIRMVTARQSLGNLRVIESGLKAGDRIVVEGLQKVRAGVKVTPQVVSITEGETPGEPKAAAAETK